MTTKRLPAIAKSLALVLGSGLLAGCGGEASNSAGAGGQATGANAASEQHEVLLSVPGMTCPMCPVTVRTALTGVDGVAQAGASLDDNRARVVFDPDRTGTDAMIAAVADAGFDASLEESANE